MKLNRYNYEEYFILYLDNELGSEDRREVELFANEHPDLKAELDMLLQSKLTPDTDITFNNKESLLVRDSSAINLNNYEEWLLSYADNELTTEEIRDVERFIAAHPEVKTELDLFQKTKLQPEAIVFPDKESLYRKEEKAKVVVIHWKRWAVAAALLIGVSTTAVILLNNKPENGAKIADKKPEAKTPTDSHTNRQPENTVPAEVKVMAITNDKNAKTLKKETPDNAARVEKGNVVPQGKNEDVLPGKNETLVIAQNPENKRGNNLPKPENNPNVNPVTTDINSDFTTKITPSATLTSINKLANATPVTTDPSKSYNTQEDEPGETEITPGAEFASNDGKKNKLRGFFRKITRTFEKRTNIKATDDEDRLLIAGLAIKLN